MAFFKFRQRGQAQPEPRGRAKESAATGAQETIDSMRRRARHRLLGAAVLVLVAVVGFPILFDTQPRPVVVDAPITIPDKDQVAPLGAPATAAADPVPATASLDDREEVVAALPPAAGGATSVAPANQPAAAPPVQAAVQPAEPARAAEPEPRTEEPRTEEARAAEEAERLQREQAARAKREQEAQAQAKRDLEAQAKREQDAQARREQQAQAKREQEAQAKREQEARARREAEELARRREAERARALLEGRSPAPVAAKPAASESGRFIVQVGAYADAERARQIRQQAERAGVRTYTQVVNTAQGQRTRVRVGPFGTRGEAEQAAAALKKAGLSGSVLSL